MRKAQRQGPSQVLRAQQATLAHLRKHRRRSEVLHALVL